jgi:hypothetical protein
MKIDTTGMTAKAIRRCKRRLKKAERLSKRLAAVTRVPEPKK